MPETPHAKGTILAFFDSEAEVWSFAVVGCRCLLPDGRARKRHPTLQSAEDCSKRTIQGSHLRLAAVKPAG